MIDCVEAMTPGFALVRSMSAISSLSFAAPSGPSHSVRSLTIDSKRAT